MKQFIGCLIIVAFIASLTSLPDKVPAVSKSALASAGKTKPAQPAKSPAVVPAPVLSSQAPAPAQVSAPAAPEPVYTVACAQYLPIIEQYSWSVPVASAIMQAESGCNPNAVSPLNYDGLSDYGLFQIHGEAIMSPAANVARAYQKYETQGWHAWTTYTSGAYLSYMR